MRIMHLPRRLGQSGDTIVEVLLALTVLSLIIGASAVTSNRSTRNLQQTQENAVADRIARGQLEYFKTYISKLEGADINTVPELSEQGFCMAPEGGDVTAGYTPKTGEEFCNIQLANSGATYTTSFTLTPVDDSPDTFDVTVKVSWEGVTVERGNIDVSYRVYNISGAQVAIKNGSGCAVGFEGSPCVPLAPALEARTQVITPDKDGSGGNVEPSCAKNQFMPLGGIRVRLTELGVADTDAPRTLTTSTTLGATYASAEFKPLKRGGTYLAEQLGVPAEYAVCPGKDLTKNFVAREGVAETATLTAYPKIPKRAVVDIGAYEYPGWHLATPNWWGRQQRMFTFTNPANSSTALRSVSPTTTGNFTITNSSCTGNLSPGASCAVWVAFTPPSGDANSNFLGNAGMRSGTLTLNNANGVTATSAQLYGRTYSNMMRPGDYINSPREWRWVSFRANCSSTVEVCNGGNTMYLHGNGNLDMTRVWQPDGRYCAYRGDSPIGDVPDGAVTLVMQGDGNFVYYGIDGPHRWHTNTWGVGNRWVKLSSATGYAYIKQGYEGPIVTKINGNEWQCPTYYDGPWE